MDGIYLRRNRGGEYENVAILVAIAVNEDGHRGVLGAAEEMKEDKASWVGFFQWLKVRGLEGVKLIVGDKCLGMLEAVGEVSPDAKYQRCTIHFYRNVFSVVPRSKVKLAAKMLKAIHAQESKAAAQTKARDVVATLKEMKRDSTPSPRGGGPDGSSALMLVCARLRHVADTQWGNKKYMNMKHMETAADDAPLAG